MSKRSSYVDSVKKNLLSLGEVKRSETPVFKPQAVEVVNATSPTNYIDTKTEETPLEKKDLTLLGRASTGTGETTPPVVPSPRASRSGSRSNLNTLRSTSRTKSNLPSTNELVRRDNERYGNTFPKGSFGSGSKPGPAVDTRPRHSVGTSKDQPKVSKFEKSKPKKGVGQGSSVAVLGRTTRRQGEKPTGPAVKITNYRDNREKQRNIRAQGRLSDAVKATGIPTRPKAGSFNISKKGKDQAAINRGIAAAKKTGIPTKPKAGSFGISEEGKKQAEANKKEARRKAAAASAAKAKKAAESKRAAAAAAKAKAEGKTKAQQAAAARKAAGSNRTMSDGQKTRSQAGPSARTAAGNRARVRSNARKRAQAAAKRRRRCDVRCKFDISLLTNNNLEIDDLAVVAYFIRDLKKINE